MADPSVWREPKCSLSDSTILRFETRERDHVQTQEYRCRRHRFGDDRWHHRLLIADGKIGRRCQAQFQPQLGQQDGGFVCECAHFRQPGRQGRRGADGPRSGNSRTRYLAFWHRPDRRKSRSRRDCNPLRGGHRHPTQLAQGKTNGDGVFKLDAGQAPEGSVLYLVAKGGTPKAAEAKGPNEKIGLLAVLGTAWSKKVTVNEFTTIASAMTCAISEWRRTRR